MKISLSHGLFCLLVAGKAVSTSSTEAKRHLRQGDKEQRKLNYYPAPTSHTPMNHYPHQSRYTPPKNTYGYVPYPRPTPPSPLPTPRPTPRPTPNPTPDPTSQPTNKPTERPTPTPTTAPPTPSPTFSPTKHPTPRPTTAPPSPYPSPSPTSYPSPGPTPEPSAAPSPEPTSEPSAHPSQMPSMPSEHPTVSQEPSENPTESAEPSENPTVSAEPSENPTQSAEPSENPTQSAEPSSTPTGSEEPTVGERLTIAGIICATENEFELGDLCDAIRSIPFIYSLLDNDLFTIPTDVSGFIPIQGLPRLPEAPIPQIPNVPPIPNIPNVPNIPIPDFDYGSPGGNRKLQLYGDDLTMFAPNNRAFRRLLIHTINDLFDANTPEVVAYFNYLGIDLVVDATLASDFFFGTNGRIFLTQILLTHIVYGRELVRKDLTCSRLITMMNGQETATICRRLNGGSRLAKFQVGEGNAARQEPRIVRPDVFASNGVLHVVNNVILPLYVYPEIPVTIPQPILVVPEDALPEILNP